MKNGKQENGEWPGSRFPVEWWKNVLGEGESSQVCKTAGNMESKAGRSIAIPTAMLQPDILILFLSLERA